MDSDICLTFLLAFAWLLTLYLYIKKRKDFSIGALALSAFLIYSICSLLFLFNSELKYDYVGLTLFPYIYLFVAQRMTISPILNCNPKSYSEIKPFGRTFFLYCTCIVFILCSFGSIGAIVKNITTGILKILTDSSAGAELYSQSGDAYEAHLATGRINVVAIIEGMLSTISTFFLFYFLTLKQTKRYIVVLLFLSSLISILSTIANGNRGGVFDIVIQYLIAYFIFSPFLSKRVKSIMKKLGLVFGLIIIFLVSLLTISRFDGYKGGNGGTSVISYFGQANLVFNKYALDDNGIRYGDRTIPLFKKMLGMNTTKNYEERRAKYPNLKVNDESFCTYVGDFTIDFGPVVGFIILLVLSKLLTRMARCNKSQVGLHNLLVVYMVGSVCIPGGMTLFNLSDYSGGLKIIVFLFFYFFIKYTYHQGQTKALQNTRE